MAREIRVEKYFPDVLSYAKEFTDIANAENPEFKLLSESLYKWFLNGFVYDLDKDGAERWEDMLGIIPKSTDTLEQRRQRILAKLNTMLPYTHRRLIEMLAGIYGVGVVKISLDYDNYWLYADIPYSLKAKVQELFTYLRVIIPANLGIGFTSTTAIRQTLFSSGLVQWIKHTHIRASTGFNPSDIVNNLNSIGKVSQIKYTKIKGGQ